MRDKCLICKEPVWTDGKTPHSSMRFRKWNFIGIWICEYCWNEGIEG